MTQRRSRVIALYQDVSTLAALKAWAGRSIELISACDAPTVTAALRLYAQLDAVIVEVSQAKIEIALAVLRQAMTQSPSMPRVLVSAGDFPPGAYAAVYDRTATSLVFAPIDPSQLSAACRFAPAPPPPLPARLRQPPLTGGIRASSSPSLSR